MLIAKLSAVFALLIHAVNARVFTKCELAKELSEIPGVTHQDIGTFVCIAERQSGLNTEIVGQGLYYGLYQVSSEFWCDSYGHGKECNLNCNDLLNDDISDDVRCLQTIIAEHQRWSGNGFSAWPSGASCQALGNSYISDCSIQSNQISASYNKNNYNSFNSGKVSSTQKKKTGKGKVYGRCELAKELGEVYGIPSHEIGTYVCLAERQSGLNTQAIGDGVYYGMYQMSSEFWCDIYGRGKACNLNCNDLLNDDLSDDLQCMQTILAEHQRLSGNGFSAWPSGTSCQAQGNSYITDCSIKSNQISTTYNNINNNDVRKAPSTQRKPSGNVGKGKVYERCELARELRYKHDIPMEHIATWVCIAKHESNFNTSAIGRLNWDGSEDHGLFQISDLYWCGPNGKACGLTCDELEDSDISNDVKCIKMIHKEHTRLSGDGFTAWAVYPRCKGQSESHIDGCFDDSDNEIIPFKPQPGVIQPNTPNYFGHPKSSVGTGKVYDRCELARELRDKHNIPLKQIATWVCIAKHESNFNTSAIGRLNWDGSEDHGLFQISDIYWCGANGKACNAQCSEFEDNDISDDIKCIKKIHEEHTRLSGDGFNAWTVYKPKCKGRSESFVKGCFDDDSNEILPFKPQPGIQQHHKVPYTKTSDQRKHYEKVPGRGKVYERCELAQELRYKFKIPMEQVSTWVCIAKHESNFNTSAIGRLNWDGSEDHGLFQISDIYWCSPPGQGKGCGLSCAELEDNDISDDVECMLKIHEEHTFLSGDGFTAWAVYRPHCQGRSESYIHGCFNDDDNYISNVRPAVTQPSTITTRRSSTTSSARSTKPFVSSTTTKRVSSTTYKTVPTTKLSTKFLTSSTTPKKVSSTTYKTIPTTKPSTKFLTSSTTPKKVSSTTYKTVSSTKPSTKYVTSSTTPKRISSTTYKTISITKQTSKTSSVAPSTTSKIVSTTPRSTTRTNQATRYFEPITTTEKIFYTTYIDTTTLSDLLTTNKIFTQPKSTQKSSTSKTVNSSSTVKPFNIFDLYFNSFKNSNSNTAPQQKNIITNQSTSKSQTTKSYGSSTIKQPNKSFNDQKSLYSSTTTKSYRVPSTTTKNLYASNSPTINLKTSTTKKSSTAPTTIQTKSTSVSTINNSITQTKQQTTTSRKSTVQTTNKPNILQTSKTSTIPKAPASFNLFSYYLTDYTSKAPPIQYKPIQFSDKSTIIFKKPNIVQPISSTAFLSDSNGFKTSTERSSIKNDAEIYGSTKASLFFNHIPTHYFNSGVAHNRVGRLVTPHSIEYLLKLTTPRTYYG